MKTSFKVFSFMSLIVLGAFGITACKNFVNASEVRDQIEKNIAYNNAQSYKISLASSIKGSGNFTSPAVGEIKKKVTDSFTLTYEPIPEYDFLEWKVRDITNPNKPVDLVPTEYFSFENLKENSTNCTFIKAPEEGIKLCIYAQITQRPAWVDYFPQWNSNGENRDSRIQVRFDKDMDESSIYYTEPEIDELKLKYNITDAAFIPKDSTKKYGYKIGTEEVWKNISITNYYNEDEPMYSYFKGPAFENPRTLVIYADRDKLAAEGTEFHVVIDKNFFCNVACSSGNKPVSLKGSLFWNYLVNGQTDPTPPTTNFNITPTLSGASGSPTILTKATVSLNVQTTDLGGSGPSSLFYMDVENVLNNEVETIPVKYQSVIGTTAKYIGNYTFQMPDGKYSVNKITVEDKSGQTAEQDFSANYFEIDRTAPVIQSFIIRPYQDTQKTFQFFSTITEKNFKEIKIKLREKGSTQDWDSITGEESSSKNGILNASNFTAAAGKIYDVRAEVFDKADNSAFIVKNDVKFFPKPIVTDTVDVQMIPDTNNAVITWQKPQDSAYDGVRITLNDNTTIIVNDSSGCRKEIKNLNPETKYTIKFETFVQQQESDDKSFSESVQTEFYTKPNPLNTDRPGEFKLDTGHYPDYIAFNNQNGLPVKISYKKKSDTQYTDYIPPAWTTYIKLENLEPATLYDIVVRRWYHTQDNLSEPVYFTGYTIPNAVTDLAVDFGHISSGDKAIAHLSWTAPEGTFTGYRIKCKKSDDTDWNSENSKTIDNIDKNLTSYDIEGLDCLQEYDFRIETKWQNDYFQEKKLNNKYTPPEKASLSLTMSLDLLCKWSLPAESPYTAPDTEIKLYYGMDETTFNTDSNTITPISLVYEDGKPKNIKISRGSGAGKLTPDKTYYFAIKTTVKISETVSLTSWSDTQSVYCPPNIMYPTYRVVGKTANTITISVDHETISGVDPWNKPTGYNCYYKLSEDGEETFAGSITGEDGRFTYQNLNPATTYYLVVRSVYNGFESNERPASGNVTTLAD